MAKAEYTTFHLRIRKADLAKLRKEGEKTERTATDILRDLVRNHLEGSA